jgi:drug/metabolite transporter (DMT)-like permease
MSEGSATAKMGSQSGSGWVEAGLFALALGVLNVSYGLGQQLGVNPVALLFWAMPTSALALLVASGFGQDWARVMAHPLSLVVGGGIIAMETVYYVLLGIVTPTDGSVLVRLGVPIAMLMGYLVVGRRPRWIGVLGGLIIVAAILCYVPQMEAAAQLAGLALGCVCGLIISLRSLAAERHPWNRTASTILEKMRVTGLVLLLASGLGVALVLIAVTGAEQGLVQLPQWMPGRHDLTFPPAMVLGLFIGVLVLTAMQYLGFSVVVKLGAERFVATTALIPLTTLGVQQMAVSAGLLAPIPTDWRVMPVMAGIIAGVALVIAGSHRSTQRAD